MIPEPEFIETILERVDAGRSRCCNAQYAISTMLAAFENLRRKRTAMHTEEPSL